MMTSKFSELAVKARFLQQLRDSGKVSENAVIANEFKIGQRGARADLAILEGLLWGIEIKSETDSTRRLQAQMAAYRLSFDRVTLILATKHLRGFDWEVAHGVEVIEVSRSGKFRTMSEPNTVAMQEPLSALMTKRDRDRLARMAGSPEENERRVFEAEFRRRHGPTSANFWAEVRSRPIEVDDLDLLSRFRPLRAAQASKALEEEARWEEWHTQAAAIFEPNRLVKAR